MDTSHITPDRFATYDYMGQYHGWHFYVFERAAAREAAIDAGIPTTTVQSIAIPPVDGKAYSTTENRPIPDPRRDGGVPPGTLWFAGGTKAEAIYKAVAVVMDQIFGKE